MAAKFGFRLQPLLDHRKRIEGKKRRDFAGCRHAVDESEGEIAALAAVRRRSIRQLAGAAGTDCVANLRLRDMHLRCLELAMENQRRRQGELRASCELARNELIVASRNRRVVEKLREWRLHAFEAKEARYEELELDEANARAREKCRA